MSHSVRQVWSNILEEGSAIISRATVILWNERNTYLTQCNTTDNLNVPTVSAYRIWCTKSRWWKEFWQANMFHVHSKTNSVHLKHLRIYTPNIKFLTILTPPHFNHYPFFTYIYITYIIFNLNYNNFSISYGVKTTQLTAFVALYSCDITLKMAAIGMEDVG
jgi:hypothetical protein